jgi:hypothetical protein
MVSVVFGAIQMSDVAGYEFLSSSNCEQVGSSALDADPIPKNRNRAPICHDFTRLRREVL